LRVQGSPSPGGTQKTLKEEITKMKKVVLMGLVGLGFGLLGGSWVVAQAGDPIPTGIHGCVWKYGGVYAAPPGTKVYGRNVSTGIVYCTTINCLNIEVICRDPRSNYANYWLNPNPVCIGTLDANGNCHYPQSPIMPFGTYSVWAEDPVGHMSPRVNVTWTQPIDVRQDLVLTNTPSRSRKP
jgi:hypothetical protein